MGVPIDVYKVGVPPAEIVTERLRPTREILEAKQERARARLAEFRIFDPPRFNGLSVEPWAVEVG